MRLELECPVDCADGPFGKLADVVVDPARRRSRTSSSSRRAATVLPVWSR
jgi:hypothetical protein